MMENYNLFKKEEAVKIKRQWVRLTRVCNNRCLFALMMRLRMEAV